MALLLVTVDGMSYKEAAEIAEVPVGTIMSRLARARMALQAKLEAGGACEGVGTMQKPSDETLIAYLDGELDASCERGRSCSSAKRSARRVCAAR